MHLRGDIIWEEHISGSHHVYVYLGNGQKVSCSSGHKEGEGVNIDSVYKVDSKSNIGMKRKIIHINDFNYTTSNSIDTTKSYFDPDKGKIIYEGRVVETSYTTSTTDVGREQTSSTNPNTNYPTQTTNTPNVTNTKAENVMTIEFLNPIELGRKHAKDFGDCTLVSSDDEYLIMDTFNGGEWPVVQKKLDEKKDSWKGCSLYISHRDGDHLNNAKRIMNNYKIDTLYLPDNFDIRYIDLSNYAKKKGIEVKRIKKGDIFYIGKAKAEVLYGPKGRSNNNNSLVTMISVETATGTKKFLTCGDIGAANGNAEKEIAETLGNKLKADIWKMNHHGLFTSNKEYFIKEIASGEKIIVIENNFTEDENHFPSTSSTVGEVKKGLKKIDASIKQVQNAAKYASAVYSSLYHGEVDINISEYGLINVDIQNNVKEEKYEIVDEKTGQIVSTYTQELPMHSNVDGYNPINDLPEGQTQAIQMQLSAGKDVGDMILKGDTTVAKQEGPTVAKQEGPIKVLLVGNSFTYYNDLGGVLAEVSKKMGKEIVVVVATHSVYGVKDLTSKNIAGYYWDTRGDKTKEFGSSHKYNTTIDSVLAKDWGDLGRASQWDYVFVQNHDKNPDTNKLLYEKVKNMVPSDGNIVIIRTTGRRSCDEMIEYANDNNNSYINLYGFAENEYPGDWKKDLTRAKEEDDSHHPALRLQYITALHEAYFIFGKTSEFIPLYNEEGETLDKVIKTVFIKKTKNKTASSVTKTDAELLQKLVYKNFDKYAQNRAVIPTNTKQVANAQSGAKQIRVNIDINNLRVNRQNGGTIISTTGDTIVEPKEIHDVITRLAEQAMNARQYSMVVPKNNAVGVICDEYGNFKNIEQTYTFTAGKMYPAYYAVNEKFDTATKNYRVLKDEFVDENGNIKEIYALVRNNSLFKTVRVAKTNINTKITDFNGVAHDIPAGILVTLIGNTANAEGYPSGTIPISDLNIANDDWVEVLTDTCSEIHKYYVTYNNIYRMAWGVRKGSKIQIYDTDAISQTDEGFVGAELREDDQFKIDDYVKLIGKKQNDDNPNQDNPNQDVGR